VGLEYGQSITIRKDAVGKGTIGEDMTDSRPNDPATLSKFGQFDKTMPVDRDHIPVLWGSDLVAAPRTERRPQKSPAATAGL